MTRAKESLLCHFMVVYLDFAVFVTLWAEKPQTSMIPTIQYYRIE